MLCIYRISDTVLPLGTDVRLYTESAICFCSGQRLKATAVRYLIKKETGPQVSGVSIRFLALNVVLISPPRLWEN